MERVIFHADMNAFFAAVEQRFNPALRGKPIIVCGNPKKRTVVAACSYEAKAFGIKNGMSVGEARRLCPGVIPVGGNPEKYVDVARHIFAIYGALTPRVEIFSIDEAFLDMTATYRFAGPEPEDAARLIKRRIHDAYGLTCSIGIGPNKLIAKVASELQKPDGLVRVRQADVAALMARLPIEDLCGVGPRLKAHLNDLGIVTCADLGQAPEALLMAKFGVIGRYLIRMGQGRDESPVGGTGEEAPAKSMGHCYTLPRDTDDEGEILGTLLRLCEQVARRLRADRFQGRTVSLTIRYADFSTMSHARTIPYPTDSGLHIYREALEVFAAHCEPLPQRVRLVGVGVSGLSQHERQLPLFGEDQRREQVDRCLDLVADRFGEFTLVRASALEPLVSKSHGFLLKDSRHPRGLVLR
jgi:DNA polymerase-4